MFYRESSQIKILDESVKGVHDLWSDKQTNRYYNFIQILAWEPSAPQITNSYLRRLTINREMKFRLKS